MMMIDMQGKLRNQMKNTAKRSLSRECQKHLTLPVFFAKDILHFTLYLHSHYRKIWKFELCEEAIFDCGSAGIPHQHCMDMIIARRMA